MGEEIAVLPIICCKGWLAKGVNSKKPTEAAEDVDTFNQTGEGFAFQLPKGWKFGFYVWNEQ